MTRLRSSRLAKIYYPTPDELQGAVPLNENLWMRQYQGLMLALANTNEGKDLLCIEDYGLPIIGMKKNVILYDQGDKYMADFRVGTKWGNVVRFRWQEVRRALERMNELRLANRPEVLFRGGRMLVPAGAATLGPIYPQPHTETVTVDGQVCRDTGYPGAGTSVSFTAMHNGAGTSVSDTGTNGYYQIYASSTTNEFFNFCRCIYGFDTSPIAGGTVTAATASFVGNEGVENLGRMNIALAGAAPNSDTVLVAADYQTCLFVAFATALIVGTNWNIGSYSDFTLNSTGEEYIKTDGSVTFFSVMSDWDRANSFGGSWGSEQVTHQGSLMADYTGTSSDPKLVVTYTPAPFVSGAIIF
jgi:hypothetical protein